MGPGCLLSLTGRTLDQAAAGARKAFFCCVISVPPFVNAFSGRISIAFRLMPRVTGAIDGTAPAEPGHVTPNGYGPIPVQSLFNNEPINTNAETTLRSALSDPLTVALLEDAMASFCGHSYGGGTLQRVYDTMQCTTCGATVEGSSMVHNLALRAAASAFKRDERMRQLHSGSLRLAKRIRDVEQAEMAEMKRPEIELPKSPEKYISSRPGNQGKGVQYPFSVNQKVMIKGNKRTPEKFVGREACITTQCLNGWYLVRLLDSGESVRLQYRSLARSAGHNGVGDDARVPAAQ